MLFVIVFFTLFLWRFVFTGLRRSLARESTASQRRHNILEHALHILGRVDPAVIDVNHSEDSSDRGGTITGGEPSETYLRRIVALTGATRTGGTYFLSIGQTQFYVRNRYVRQVPEGANATWARRETCFHPAHHGMPDAEQIASVLLQLKNNPTLFDSWAFKHEVAFKADGQVFRGAQ